MTDAQVDFTTQFETVYDLLSEHDHDALRQVLRDRLSVVEDTGDIGVAPPAESLFLVCRMNVASSTRRVSSVSIRHDDQLNFKVDTSLGTYNVQGRIIQRTR